MIAVPYYKEAAYGRFLKEQVGKLMTSSPSRRLRSIAWRSKDAWFCDELVAAGLEHAEVVRRLAPCVNRLDLRDLYLVVSPIARVS